jgi:hypothetical protein
VEGVDRPRATGVDPDIRFLTRRELEALLRATGHDEFGPTDHAPFLAAAMTGLRQGELLAQRWQDVDWASGVIRVRRTCTRGRFGTPKSRRSSPRRPNGCPASPTSSASTSTARCSPPTTTSSSPTPTSGPCSTRPSCAAASRPRSTRLACVRWLPRPTPHLRHCDGRAGARFACSRSGSATATTRQPRSMPTTRPMSHAAPPSHSVWPDRAARRSRAAPASPRLVKADLNQAPGPTCSSTRSP